MQFASSTLARSSRACIQYCAVAIRNFHDSFAPQALAEQLKGSADVVMSMGLGNLPCSGAVQRALDAAGVPYIGPPGEVVDLVSHKLRC